MESEGFAMEYPIGISSDDEAVPGAPPSGRPPPRKGRAGLPRRSLRVIRPGSGAREREYALPRSLARSPHAREPRPSRRRRRADLECANDGTKAAGQVGARRRWTRSESET